MNQQQIIKKIEQLQKQLEDLKKEEMTKETFIIGNFEVTKPKVCKTYEEAKKCPKGFRLPTRLELWTIFDKIEDRKKLSDGGFMLFWSSTIENDYVSGLCLDGGLGLISGDGDLANSYGDGRVIYVRKK